jgi:fatty acid desaturase
MSFTTHAIDHYSKKKFGIFSLWIPYVIGQFCGQTWNTYYFHHIKMHHVTDNGPEDASSTLLYQRDSILGWLIYFGRFYFWNWYDMGFFFFHKSQVFYILAVIFGEYVILGLALYLTLFTESYSLPTIFVFLIPFHLVRVGMMQGNWAQHAFLDRMDPHGGGRKNSITCISCSYNARSYNDGYHASHHLNPLRHWMDHPRIFLKQRKEYEDEQAVVFKDLDYPDVWIRLMMGNYQSLANYWVHVGDGPRPSDEEIIELLKSKTKRFTKEEVFKIYGKKTWFW